MFYLVSTRGELVEPPTSDRLAPSLSLAQGERADANKAGSVGAIRDSRCTAASKRRLLPALSNS